MPLAAVPTLDAIAERPERGAELPRRVAVDLYFRALTVLQALAPALSAADGLRQDPDRFLVARDVAARLGKSVKWVYAHAHELPFAVRIDGQHPRFSERELQRWMETMRNAGSAAG